MSLGEFDGSVVWVTGSSKGIGRAIAQGFADQGATVVVHGRNEDDVAKTVDSIERTGGKAFSVVGNVREHGEVTRMVEQIAKTAGRLDILVNNAGGVFASPLESISANGWNATIATNLSGVFFCSSQALPLLKVSGRGNIINIGSIAGSAAHPLRAAYGAAKAGVNALTMSMSYEWAEYGIRVNCVAPGAIGTDASRFANPDIAAKAAALIPLGRLGHPSDVAGACLYLASDSASFVTGVILPVTGGPNTALPQMNLLEE